jgi:uncharacterized coiled-coil protein SlyX
MEPEERVRQLEMRVAVSEKSNRALLEEVLRLQSDLKGSARHNDEMVREICQEVMDICFGTVRVA